MKNTTPITKESALIAIALAFLLLFYFFGFFKTLFFTIVALGSLQLYLVTKYSHLFAEATARAEEEVRSMIDSGEISASNRQKIGLIKASRKNKIFVDLILAAKRAE